MESHFISELRWNSQLRLAAEAEQGSEHPLANAIVEGAKARGLNLGATPETFTALAGRGLQNSLRLRRFGRASQG